MTARTLVVDSLAAVFEGTEVTVRPYATGLGTLTGPTVLVRLDTVTPSSNPRAWITYSVSLAVLSALTDALAAETELDDLLLDVLFAVDACDALTWDSATRATFDDSLHGYQVVLTVHVTKD